MAPSGILTPLGRDTAVTARALTGSPALAFFAFIVLSNSACINCLEFCAKDDNGKQAAAAIVMSQIFINVS
jgi:hypothetical protein